MTLIVRPYGDDCLVAVAVTRTRRHQELQQGKGIHIDRDGYAKAWDPRRRKQVGAHRMVAEWAFGPLAGDEVVHHTCRTRRCLNPQLRPMTRAEHAAEHARLRRAS